MAKKKKDKKVAIGARVLGDIGEVVGTPGAGALENARALPPITMGAQRPITLPPINVNTGAGGAVTPPTNPMENFRWFGQGGALQGLGAGMAGFAAPHLGQQWTAPKADTSNMDFMRWMMKQGIKNKLKEIPKEMQADTVKALEMISINPEEVKSIYQALASKYPKYSSHLKRVFYPKSATVEQTFMGEVENFLSTE